MDINRGGALVMLSDLVKGNALKCDDSPVTLKGSKR